MPGEATPTPAPPRRPNGLVAVDGKLYGTTYGGGLNGEGVVFSVSREGKEQTVYLIRSGYNSESALLFFSGDLYGTTVGGGAYHAGTLFGIGHLNHKLNFKYEFGSKSHDGNGPDAALVQHNQLLYGVTAYGGTSGDGTAFSIDPGTGRENVLYSFKGGFDGSNPAENLAMLNGKFYSTAQFGGGNCNGIGCGVLYRVDPATGTEKVLYAFQGGSDGQSPSSGLLVMNGKLYGVTRNGGAGSGCLSYGCGTVFEFDPATSTETILHAFDYSPNDGFLPNGNLTEMNGVLYGTTFAGGATDSGTVFEVNPSTHAESLVYSFHGISDGSGPFSGLIAVKGELYGTASAGGANKRGTVFGVTTSGQETTLHNF